LLFIILLVHPALTQPIGVATFKGVKTKFPLKYGDTLIKKGTYEFEISVIVTGSQKSVFYLRIKEKGKTLCDIPGDNLEYSSKFLGILNDDPNIPDKPTIKIKKYPVNNMANVIFESGKKARAYPYSKVRFKMEYVE